MDEKNENKSASTNTNDEEALKELKELSTLKDIDEKQGICPHCRRCPTCGRRLNDYSPWYPDPYPWPAEPSYPRFYWRWQATTKADSYSG